MISGSKLKMVDLPRSIGDFHGVWACSGVIQALSLSLSLTLCFSDIPDSEVNNAQIGSWRG
jgi:hypothetical protein